MATPAESRPPAPSEFGVRSLSRRSMLKGIAGVAGVTATGGLLAACSTGSTASPSGGGGTSAAPSTGGSAAASAAALTGNLTVGSYHSSPDSEVKAMADIADAFAKETGVTVKLNKVDHNTFQDQITNYLNGTPDDAFTWFSGYRMQFFADQGLATPVDDVYEKVAGNFAEGFHQAVIGHDGKIYGIPVDYYPWCVFYRKSIFEANSIDIPTTWDEFKQVCETLKGKNITPLAFGDKDGWPAMGTFDALNLRTNGYQFHVDLLGGKVKWTEGKAKGTFEKWREILPYHQDAFAGRTWQDTAGTLAQKKAAMCVIGLFVSSVFTDEADVKDLDFFPFPNMGNEFDAEKALDAPIDVWMISSKSPSLDADLDNAKAFLEYWAKGSTQQVMFKGQPGFIPTAKDADTSTYSDLQKKAVEIVSAAGKIAQFLDRDTRPDFAGPNGMQGFLLDFLKNPDQDLDAFLGKIQSFWDQLPPVT